MTMLYMPFRKALRRFARAASAFDDHVGPEFLEELSPEHEAFLELLDRTQRQMRRYLRCFPEAPPDFPEDENGGFGPIVHEDDMRLAASIVLPLALALNKNVPVESYGPVLFLREKCELLGAAMEIYVGWRKYATGKSKTKWQGYPRLTSETAFRGLVLVDDDDKCLSRLFDNLRDSIDRGRQAIEFNLGCSADLI